MIISGFENILQTPIISSKVGYVQPNIMMKTCQKLHCNLFFKLQSGSVAKYKNSKKTKRCQTCLQLCNTSELFFPYSQHSFVPHCPPILWGSQAASDTLSSKPQQYSPAAMQMGITKCSTCSKKTHYLPFLLVANPQTSTHNDLKSPPTIALNI